MRFECLEDVVGQVQVVGLGMVLCCVISGDRIFLLIFWGLFGIGKMMFVSIIVRTICHVFVPLFAVLGGVKEVR